MILALLVAAIVPAGQTFTCTPVRVWDGDGPVWCAEGPRVRLAGIAAREMDGTCRDNQPCPSVDPRTARDALVGLLGVPAGQSTEGHILVEGPGCTARRSVTLAEAARLLGAPHRDRGTSRVR